MLILRRNLIALLIGISFVGRAIAQQVPSSIEQSRLLQGQQPIGVSTNVNADGTALGETSGSSDDDSFGAQLILKNQERRRSFSLTGDTSLIYTTNVALTRQATQPDSFFVGTAGAVWMPKVATHFEAQVAAHASTFRYFNNSELDFTNFGAGAGLAYAIPSWSGFSIFARYDFTELLNRHGREVLTDQQFTLGAQKAFLLGRSHALTLGFAGSAGISDPHAVQRDLLGAFIGYHLNLTRSLETDLSYRFGLHFYNEASRIDRNQLLSWTLRYRFNAWSDVEAFLTYGNNRSDVSVFDYDVLTTGGGVSINVRF